MSSGAIVPISTRARLSRNELLRELQRLPLHGEVVDGEDEIPIGVLDVARGDRDRLLQLHVGDLAVLPADEHLLARRVDLEVAQQRLRVVERDRRVELRVEAC